MNTHLYSRDVHENFRPPDFVEFAMKQIAQTVSKRLGQKVNAGSAGGGGGSSGGDSSSDGGDTIVLTDGEFDSTVMEDEKNVWFIKFYAPWCGHCKAMAGDWDSLATQFKGKVKVAKVDATVETVSAGKFGVQGFPSIKLLPAGRRGGGLERGRWEIMMMIRLWYNKGGGVEISG